jgi:hypothetical protein
MNLSRMIVLSLLLAAGFQVRLLQAQRSPMNTKPNLLGIPEINVLLSGTPDAIELDNRTNRTIIGYAVTLQRDNGGGETRQVVPFLAMRHGQKHFRAGAGRTPLEGSTNRTEVAPIGARAPGRVIKAQLQAVMFEDGEVQGPFAEVFIAKAQDRIQAEQDVDRKLLAARGRDLQARNRVWQELDDLRAGRVPLQPTYSPAYEVFAKATAEELIKVRTLQREDAAFRLAETSEKYPKLWRRR